MSVQLSIGELKKIKKGLKDLTPEIIIAAFNGRDTQSRYRISGIIGAFALQHETKTSEKGKEYTQYKITHFGDGYSNSIGNGPLGLYYYILNELGVHSNLDWKSPKFSSYNFHSDAFDVNQARFIPYGETKPISVPFNESEKKALLELRDLILEKNVQGEYQIREDLLNESLQILSSNRKNKKYEFIPPSEDVQVTERVFQYLHNQRGIPQEVLDRAKMQKDYTIYGYRAGYDERALFYSEKAAEWRSIKGDGKQSYPGSESNTKNGTCYVIRGEVKAMDLERVETEEAVYMKVKPNTTCFAITEAAIDALSYNAIFPDRAVMASNGSVKNILIYKYAKKYRDAGHSIRLATDADTPGDIAAQLVYNAFYLEELLKANNIDSRLVEKMTYGESLFFDVKGHSEHILFFGANVGAELKSEYKAKIVVEDPEGGLQESLSKSKPIIRVSMNLPKTGGETKALKGLFEQMAARNECRIVSNNSASISVDIYANPAIHDMVAKYTVRERPLGAKDWNEILKTQLGQAYHVEFSKVAKEDFRDKNGRILLPSLGDNKNQLYRHYSHLDVKKEWDVIKKESTENVAEIAQSIQDISLSDMLDNEVKHNKAQSQENSNPHISEVQMKEYNTRFEQATNEQSAPTRRFGQSTVKQQMQLSNSGVDVERIMSRLQERREMFRRYNVEPNGENALSNENKIAEKTKVLESENTVEQVNANENTSQRPKTTSKLRKFLTTDDLASGSGEGGKYSEATPIQNEQRVNTAPVAKEVVEPMQNRPMQEQEWSDLNPPPAYDDSPYPFADEQSDYDYGIPDEIEPPVNTRQFRR